MFSEYNGKTTVERSVLLEKRYIKRNVRKIFESKKLQCVILNIFFYSHPKSTLMDNEKPSKKILKISLKRGKKKFCFVFQQYFNTNERFEEIL